MLYVNDPGSFSCGAQRYSLFGNLAIADEIECLANKAIRNNISLYDAQDNIKQYLIEKYGFDWYCKSAEAVQYVIEDAYASSMRRAESWGNCRNVWFWKK